MPPKLDQAKPVAAPLKLDRHENIYTIPNALTVGRILATPVIGYYVLQGEIAKATALLFVAGVSDLVSAQMLLTCQGTRLTYFLIHRLTAGSHASTVWEAFSAVS